MEVINVQEVWKPITNYDSTEISTLGRIRDRKSGNILPPRRTSATRRFGKYYITYIWSDSRENLRKALIHELVAEAFIPNWNDKKRVKHKDGDIYNNNVNNLEWCDDSDIRPKKSRKASTTK